VTTTSRSRSPSSRAQRRAGPTRTSGSSRGTRASSATRLRGSGAPGPPPRAGTPAAARGGAAHRRSPRAGRGRIAGTGASAMTRTRVPSTPRSSSTSVATACVGTITTSARCTARWRSRSRIPGRSCSERRLRAAMSWIVTTCGTPARRDAPSIHGAWKIAPRRGGWTPPPRRPARGLAQRREQAAHVAPDAAGVPGAAGVVGDRHRHARRLVECSRTHMRGPLRSRHGGAARPKRPSAMMQPRARPLTPPSRCGAERDRGVPDAPGPGARGRRHRGGGGGQRRPPGT
jgi:hypothetical protein